jgi:hypothetical protein
MPRQDPGPSGPSGLPAAGPWNWRWNRLGGRFISGLSHVTADAGMYYATWLYGRGTNGRIYTGMWAPAYYPHPIPWYLLGS